ncbi:uncharacterized protein LOC107038203 [Diachasma alloeum]|uniref:uncharacterized protein LOC107038203 n=1 Tax=Diachasma alloeum TaxID=454923 RepID=UPI0007382292|nr:uncharacterized protein LOC107038203 [Diachasma alloeum]
MDSDERAALNYDCNYNLLLAKRLIKKLVKLQDRKLVVQWLKYLMSFNENLSEMELRNDFMYHLVLNMQEGSLKPPFSSQPSTKTPISELTHLIPGRSDKTMTVEEMMAEIDGDVNLGSNKPLVMEKSPDGGAFFAQQPMPHEGAFAYLTISTKAHRSMKKCPLD